MLLFSSWQAERTFAVTNMNVRHADEVAVHVSRLSYRFAGCVCWPRTLGHDGAWASTQIFGNNRG
jgi:hypothetical protein